MSANSATQSIVYLFVGLAALGIVLDHAHLACPIWLGWQNKKYREYMLAHPEKFVLLPALCVMAAVGVGMSVRTTGDPAFRILTTVYVWWNAWHFGSQHYGVASLLGWRSGPRWARQVAVIGATMFVMLAPIDAFAVVMLTTVISIAHWLTDIGLTAWIAGRPAILVVTGLIVFGLIGFVWKPVTTDQRFCQWLPACSVVWSFPVLLSLRYGLGFWHFLMSRWVWKLSDRQVRLMMGVGG